ncbi:MAG: hypothetical protein ACI85O_002410, partial [Saprospiraceae bacterium]
DTIYTDTLKTSLFRYFPLKNSSVVQTMQRFLKENYRKNLSLKFIHINNVTHLYINHLSPRNESFEIQPKQTMSIYQRRPEIEEIPEYYQNYVRQVEGNGIELILDNALKETLAFLELLPNNKWAYRYAPEKWTIKELILHLIDSERVFAYRILCMSRGDTTPLPGFDQDIFVPNSDANNRSGASLTAEYKAVREATLQLVRHFTPEMWERKGTASGVTFLPITIAYITAGHEAHHMRIIRERYL